MASVEERYRGTPEYYLVFGELIQAARYRGVTTYPAVAALMGLPFQGNHMGREVSQVLAEISQVEAEKGRPMLSAVAVSSVSLKPGRGFYAMARHLGKLGDGDDEERFWKSELKAVYDCWKRTYD